MLISTKDRSIQGKGYISCGLVEQRTDRSAVDARTVCIRGWIALNGCAKKGDVSLRWWLLCDWPIALVVHQGKTLPATNHILCVALQEMRVKPNPTTPCCLARSIRLRLEETRRRAMQFNVEMLKCLHFDSSTVRQF
jgi:hypothetical protein